MLYCLSWHCVPFTPLKKEKPMSLSETLEARGIMVDVESAGPDPEQYALLSLGACLIREPSQRFYVELIPDRLAAVPAALRLIGFDLAVQQRVGCTPSVALCSFHQWIEQQEITDPLFVAHNSAFDWMFYIVYCARYRVSQPFGHKPFDTASHFWEEPVMTTPLPHHAGEDAYLQTLDLRRYLGIQ